MDEKRADLYPSPFNELIKFGAKSVHLQLALNKMANRDKIWKECRKISTTSL